MAVEQKLVVEKRDHCGTRECQRLRRQGLVPGNIYGHGQETVSISGEADIVTALVTSGTHVIELELEGRTETTILREVQWDVFGSHILHFDLMRVDPNERVTVEVNIELRGVAPGSLAGGILTQPLHSLEIDCPAVRIPTSIPVRIGHLEIGQAVHVSDLGLPEYIAVLTPSDSVVAQVTAPFEVPEAEEEGADVSTEPELIERKGEEGEGDSD